MIYNLILNQKILSFARVKISGDIRTGHNIRFRDTLYRVIEIDGNDVIVMI